MADATATGERGTPENRKWVDKTWVQIFLFVGGLMIYLLIGLALWWLLDKYIQPQKSSQKKDLIQALSLIMAGLGGGIGLYFTWQNTKLSRENTKAQLQQAKESTEAQLRQAKESTEAQLHQARESQSQTQESTRKTLNLTEQGQITDRFTRAIDQLGATNDDKSKRIEIRLGGIYALEQIAKHSPEHYSPVMEVLTAYVKENARWNPDESSGPTLKWQQAATSDTQLITSEVPTDIQAILDVLGRREEERIPENYRISISLHQANLSGADFVGANLA